VPFGFTEGKDGANVAVADRQGGESTQSLKRGVEACPALRRVRRFGASDCNGIVFLYSHRSPSSHAAAPPMSVMN